MNDELKQALGPSPECPDIELLGKLADGAVEPHVRSEIEGHLNGCAHCRSELTMLREFVTPAIDPSDQPAVDWIAAQLRQRESKIFEKEAAAAIPWWRRIFRVPSMWRAALVLGALLVATGVTLYLRNGSAPQLNPGSDSGPDVLRSNSVVLIAPAGDLEKPPAKMRWQSVPKAARYEIHVMEVDRNDLWSGETVDTQIDFPDTVKARMAPAKSLLWSVTALDGAGKKIASSSDERFRIAIH